MSKSYVSFLRTIMFHAYREACRNNRPMSVLVSVRG